MTLVHHMGGIIRRDFSSKVTHLVANSTHGDKFRVCKLELILHGNFRNLAFVD